MSPSIDILVGGFNPSEKYYSSHFSQNGNLPQVGVKIKTVWNHHPVPEKLEDWVL